MGPAHRSSVLLACLLVLPGPLAAALTEETVTLTQRSLTLYIPAVGQRPNGTLVGVSSTLTVTLQTPGQGSVYVRTEPLAEIDMQGAARLAVVAAHDLTGERLVDHDYFFTVTAGSPVIGGPSAGGAMAIAVVALLEGWDLKPHVAMTGMINPDGSIGPIGGILYKVEAMAGVGVTTFLIPAGQRIQYVEDAATGRRAVDVAEYARETWGMRVVEVEDLYAIVPEFTDHRFEVPEAHVDPTRAEQYQALMRSVALEQVANASVLLRTVEAAYANINSTMSTGDRAVTADELETAKTSLTRAENASAQQRYYQASSFAFQSTVAARYAQTIVDYYVQGRPSIQAYTEDYVRQAAERVQASAGFVSIRYPIDMSGLGAQAAIESRFVEANESLALAQDAVKDEAWPPALKAASFAWERANGIAWWSRIRAAVREIEGQANVTRDALRFLAQDYGDSAALVLAYGERVVAGTALLSRLVAAAEELERGQAMVDAGQLAAGTFAFLRSISQVNAAIAAGNSPESLSARLEDLRQRTAFEIELVRSFGSEPVFAVSQYEFALALETTDPGAAHEAYSWARMAARASIQAAALEFVPRDHPIERVPVLAPEQQALRGFAWASLLYQGLPAVFAVATAGLITILSSARRGQS